MTETLLPCPFCGSPAEICLRGANNDWVVVKCGNRFGSCVEMVETLEGRKYLIRQWNTRTCHPAETFRKWRPGNNPPDGLYVLFTSEDEPRLMHLEDDCFCEVGMPGVCSRFIPGTFTRTKRHNPYLIGPIPEPEEAQ